MSVSARQVAIGGLEDPADELAEIEAGYLWRDALWSAMRTFVAGYISVKGTRGYDAVANELEARWAVFGRPVSASVLRAALSPEGNERNYFRLEWADWFAARSPEIADLLARRVKPTKTPQQQIADLEAELREELPKRADAVIRRARAR